MGGDSYEVFVCVILSPVAGYGVILNIRACRYRLTNKRLIRFQELYPGVYMGLSPIGKKLVAESLLNAIKLRKLIPGYPTSEYLDYLAYLFYDDYPPNPRN